jgi:transglutaminase-like putative cysteine protease
MMKYRVVHKTVYQYREPVSGYHSVACLYPRPTPTQVCSAFDLKITPAPAEVVRREDFFGNQVHYFSIQVPHKELVVEARSQVENHFSEPELHLNSSYGCREARELFQRDLNTKSEVMQYMLPSSFVQWDEEVQAFARDSFADDRPLYDSIKSFCGRIYADFAFIPDATTVHTPLKTVLREKKGVCQDFSHLALAGIRSMGFAARYVSGYLETQPPPGKVKLQGSDASHAWISAYVPGIGWCDFDPTNNVVPRQKHITTAWGRDYGDVPPLKGILLSSGQQRLKVEVDVVPTG